MKTDIDKLNKKIKKHVGEYGKADEVLFNIGIELGRILQKNDIKELRLDFFVQQENEHNQTEAKRNRIDSVNKIIQNIIGWAHKEQFNKTGTIHYESGWRADNKPLSEEVESKFNITYSRINQNNVGGDFDIYFMLNGKLKEIFEKHKVGIQVETTLGNSSGEEDEYLTSEDDAENSFYSTHISLYPHHDNKTVEEIDAFATDVEKFYTIFCLKLT
jgi:hypothetical protein